MKKYILAVLTLAVTSPAFAVHQLIFRDASALTTGTVSTSLLDLNTITQGVISRLLFPNPFTLVVGTQGTPGVNMFVYDLNTFNMALSSIGANGLTSSTTGFGTIAFKSGLYAFAGATIPAGVTCTALPGSSVVWKVTDGTQQLVRIFGTLDGFKFDLYGQGIASQLIDLKNGSRFTNFDIYGASQTPTNNTTYRYALMNVRSSTNVTIQGTMREFPLLQDTGANEGENAYLKVYDSTDVFITLRALGNGNVSGNFGGNNAFSFIHTTRSKNVNITNGYFKDLPGTIFRMGNGSVDMFFESNRIEITTFVPVNSFGDGMISFENRSNGGTPYTTTGTISISYNLISISTGGVSSNLSGGNFIWVGAQGGGAVVNGVEVRGNYMTLNAGAFGNPPSMTVLMRFATVTAQSQATIFQDNYVGCGASFVTDSGNGTVTASVGNIFKGAAQ